MDTPDSTTTVTKSDPWAGQMPYLNDIFAQSRALFEGPGAQFYPGQTVAGFTPEQQQALGATASRAALGSPLNAGAQSSLLDIIGGGQLNANPAQNIYAGIAQGTPGNNLDDIFSNVQSRVLPAVQSAYTAAGRSPGGAGGYADTATRALTESFAPYAMQAGQQNIQNKLAGAGGLGNLYDQAQQRQMQGIFGAPQLAQTDYGDLSQLFGVGAQLRDMNQQQINADIARYQYGQQLPYSQLAQYAQFVQGAFPGGTQTTTAPYTGPSTGQQLLGGGLGILGSLLPLMFLSSSILKERIEPADEDAILEKLANLPVNFWSYIGDPIRHVGPMAEDFRDIFGVGDGVTLHVADVLGVLTAAGKALARRAQEGR